MSVEFARLLSVESRHTNTLGLAFGISFIIVITLLCHKLLPNPIGRRSGTALILFSFPTQLALERSNIDLPIFLLIATLATLTAFQQRLTSALAAATAWLLVAIKIYPFVGLMAWSGSAFPRISRQGLFVMIGCIAGLATSLTWLVNHGDTAENPGVGWMSHGLVGESQYRSAVSLAIFCVACYYIYRSQTGRQLTTLLDSRYAGLSRKVAENLISMNSFTWIGCYLLSTSYDYRLIFAFPGIIAQAAIFTDKKTRPKCMHGNIVIAVAALTLVSTLFRWLPAPLDRLIIVDQITSPIANLIVFPSIAGVLLAQQISRRSKNESSVPTAT